MLFWEMARVTEPKEKTVIAAAKLFRRQGYHGTALHDILDAGGAPRGSLYFHFPRGKEEIGEAAIAMVAERVRLAIDTGAKTSASVEEFLTRVIERGASDLEQSNFQEGCPIATLALEVAGQSEALGAAAGKAFKTWEDELKRGLEHFGMAPADAGRLASMVLGQFEGALLLARTYRNMDPIHRAVAAVKILAATESRQPPAGQSPQKSD
jgi:TetR/AcrR family transcriptional repressor of lmrAB and yxaGH operons